MSISSDADDREDGRMWQASGRSSRSSDSFDRTDLTLTRVEAKLDGFIQAQNIRDESLRRDMSYIRETHVSTSTDHEARIRALESRMIDPARVHNLEQRRYVEPKTVWTAVVVLTGVGALIVAIVNIIVK